MKHLTIIPLLVLLSCAGTGRLYITEDEFTKEKNSNMEARYNAEESPGVFYDRYYLSVTYVKQLGKDEPVTMYLKLHGFPENPGQPNGQAMVKINGTPYTLPLLNPKVEVDYVSGQTMQQTGFYHGTVYRRITAKALITKELEEALSKATEVSMRFYAGTTPVTVKVPAKDLMRVKELLAAK